MFCRSCGAEISDQAAICVKCGVPNTPASELNKSEKSRIAYILLGFFLGGLGIHNFYAGRTGTGVVQLLITVFTCWMVFPLIAIGLWVLIEICTVTKDGRGKRLA
jgi:TM2 domain-containing membrane protein YozV